MARRGWHSFNVEISTVREAGDFFVKACVQDKNPGEDGAKRCGTGGGRSFKPAVSEALRELANKVSPHRATSQAPTHKAKRVLRPTVLLTSGGTLRLSKQDTARLLAMAADQAEVYKHDNPEMVKLARKLMSRLSKKSRK